MTGILSPEPTEFLSKNLPRRIRHKGMKVLFVCFCIMATCHPTTQAASPSFDPWLIYRSMGLEDLNLALIQMDQHLERLKAELPRTEKLVRSGASPRMELVDLSGQIQIRMAEREELVALRNWLTYLQILSSKDQVFDETKYFEMFTGLLKPRAQHALIRVEIANQERDTLTKLRERRAISAEQYEQSNDNLQEKKAQLLFYRAQYLAALHALEVRLKKREYVESEAMALAQAVCDARIGMWQAALDSVNHQLTRLSQLKQRGIISDSEISAVSETHRIVLEALQKAKAATPDPYAAPGLMKRPQIQSA